MAPTLLRNPVTGKMISVNKLPAGSCRTQAYFNTHATNCINLGIRQGLNPQ